MNESNQLFGVDLQNELQRLREQNASLTASFAKIATASLVAVAIGLVAFFKRPAPDRVAVDPQWRVVQMTTLTENDPPDSRITKFAGECISDALNHAFHNYQTTVERAIGSCFTGGGSESVRQALDPLLKTMRDKKLNMETQFLIQPFINSRDTDKFNRHVFHIQAIIMVGYRSTGEGGSTRPLKYALSTDVVRVPYDSQIEGIRLQNLILSLTS